MKERLGRETPAEYFTHARGVRRGTEYEPPDGLSGTMTVPWRRVRNLRLGLRCRRARDRSGHVRGAPDQADRGRGNRRRFIPCWRAARSRAEPRRDSAARSSKKSSCAMADGERAAHQLHDSDDARHAADRRRDARAIRTRADRSAQKASASCRWMDPLPRSSTPSVTRARRARIPATPERLMSAARLEPSRSSGRASRHDPTLINGTAVGSTRTP